MKKKALFVLTFLMSSLLLGAQPQGEAEGRPPKPPKMKTPEEIAKHEADMMQAEIGINEKQYKKVYNLIRKDYEYRQSQAQANMPSYPGGGRPPQGGPEGGYGGGMPPQGGYGMGRPEGGDMMRGGMPPQGERPQGPPPGSGMGPGENLVTDEYLEKQDKKLQKILTEKQYSQWRQRHPAEHQDLPPVEFNLGE